MQACGPLDFSAPLPLGIKQGFMDFRACAEENSFSSFLESHSESLTVQWAGRLQRLVMSRCRIAIVWWSSSRNVSGANAKNWITAWRWGGLGDGWNFFLCIFNQTWEGFLSSMVEGTQWMRQGQSMNVTGDSHNILGISVLRIACCVYDYSGNIAEYSRLRVQPTARRKAWSSSRGGGFAVSASSGNKKSGQINCL